MGGQSSDSSAVQQIVVIGVSLVACLCCRCCGVSLASGDSRSCAVGESGDDVDLLACPRGLEGVEEMLNRTRPRNCHRWTLENATSSRKAVLGVLIPIYDLDTTGQCTKFERPLGVELMEAVRFAVRDELARRDSLRAVLGAVEFRDSCYSARICVQQALTFAVSSPGAMHFCRSNFSDAVKSTAMASAHSSGTGTGDARHQAPGRSTCGTVTERVAAIVGPAISSTLKVTSPALSIFKIPHISYWATSELFSKKREYQYLFRTVPSDEYQARAMVKLLADQKWTYVVALSSNDDITGGLGLDAFRHGMASVHMCIAFEERFHYLDIVKIDQIIWQLVAEKNKANAILLWAGWKYARALFNRMEQLYANDTNIRHLMEKRHFVWIASDGWIARGPDFFFDENHKQRFGGNHTLLGFVFRVPAEFWQHASDFNERLKQHMSRIPITWENLHGNPGLALIRSDDCSNFSLSDMVQAGCSVSLAGNYPPVESGSLMLAVRAALNVIDVAFADCRSNATCKVPTGDVLREMMLNVNSSCHAVGNVNTSQCRVFHRENQDLQASYMVKKLVLDSEMKPKLTIVSYWVLDEHAKDDEQNFGRLDMNNGTIFANVDERPTSVCALPCEAGQQKKPDEDSECCWSCEDCSATNRVLRPGIDTQCNECDPGEKPNVNSTGCEPIEPEYIDYPHPGATAIIAVAAVGASVVLATGFIYHKYRLTKVVQSNGQALANLLLAALLLGFLSCAVFFNRPTTASCSVFAVLSPVVIVFSTATVMVRTLRLAGKNKAVASGSKVLWWMRKARLDKFKAQLSFVATVTIIPNLVLALWVLTDPIKTARDKSDPRKVLLQCERRVAFTGLVAFIFLVLILGTAAMAFQTRKLPSNYKESKLVHLTSFALCIIWIPLTVTFFIDSTLQPVIVALRILAHMLAIWSCMFLPRLYIILLRPQHNPRLFSPSSAQGGERRASRLYSALGSLVFKPQLANSVRSPNGSSVFGSSNASNGSAIRESPSSSRGVDSVILESHLNGALRIHRETSL